MNYLLQSSKRNRKRFFPLIFTLVFVGLVVLLTFVAPSFFGGVSHGVGRPVWSAGGFFSHTMSNLQAFIISRANLLEMNRDLTLALEDSKTRLMALSLLERENAELKKSWGRVETTGSILASVLLRPPQSLYDTIIVDVGENDGVALGSEVTASDTVALGTIDEVFGHTARARLFSSVGVETPGVIDRNSMAVTLIGTGGGSFELRLPQEVDVVEGDIIALPGIKQRIAGTVIDIEVNPTNSFKRVLCKTPVNIGELRFVSIVKTQ